MILLRIFLASIIVLFVARAVFSAENHKLRPCLSILAAAERLSDGVSGESKVPPSEHVAYLEAEKCKFSDIRADLDWLCKHATPAGRIYAACLIYKSDSRLGIARLETIKHSDEKLFYQSGCKVCETTLKEVAGSLLKEGRFINFKLAINRN